MPALDLDPKRRGSNTRDIQQRVSKPEEVNTKRTLQTFYLKG
tara:strand:+ start:233 stop:358 length:126 start_codon:yes stop_codon:yes gene_type:complete